MDRRGGLRYSDHVQTAARIPTASRARHRVRHARDEGVDDVLRNAHIDPGEDVAFVTGMARAIDAKVGVPC
jgi:hypothetical protein